jgi:hypothetical protein
MNIKGFYRQTKEFKIETAEKPKLSLQTVTKDYEIDCLDVTPVDFNSFFTASSVINLPSNCGCKTNG